MAGRVVGVGICLVKERELVTAGGQSHRDVALSDLGFRTSRLDKPTGLSRPNVLDKSRYIRETETPLV